MDLGEFVKDKKRQCILCRFYEQHPEAAKQIRHETTKGALKDKRPTAYAALILRWIIEKYNYPMTAQNIHDHYRRGHEGRPAI